MKIVVISYSLTGNNEALAKNLAEELSADHLIITEPKPRTTLSIVIDLVLNRIPKVQPEPAKLKNYDLILFLAPVWIGNVATPLRAYFKYLKANPHKYAFISISGGADGANLKLAGELKKRVRKQPLALLDFHIADLLPTEPKPTRKDTSNYLINTKDIENLTHTIEKTVREVISDTRSGYTEK